MTPNPPGAPSLKARGEQGNDSGGTRAQPLASPPPPCTEGGPGGASVPGGLGVLALLLLASPAAAVGLLSKNHPLVDRGNRAFADGKYDEALAAYDEAEQALPRSAEVAYNRGNALYKLGRLDEAREAYARALIAEDSELRASDYFNMGNAFAGMGKDEEAIDAYRRALALRRNDADTRHNLELVLRRREQKPPQAPDGGADAGPGSDGGRPDAGRDGGADGGGDGGAGDGGRGDGGRGDAGRGDGGRGDAGADTRPDDGRDGGAADAARSDGGTALADRPREDRPISKQEAERILDSLRRNEKSFQSWRFQKRTRRNVVNDW